jgi:hypothetical protein
VALLAAETLGFRDGYTLEAHLLQGLLHFIELERLDNRFDFFHVVRLLFCQADSRTNARLKAKEINELRFVVGIDGFKNWLVNRQMPKN